MYDYLGYMSCRKITLFQVGKMQYVSVQILKVCRLFPFKVLKSQSRSSLQRFLNVKNSTTELIGYGKKCSIIRPNMGCYSSFLKSRKFCDKWTLDWFQTSELPLTSLSLSAIQINRAACPCTYYAIY